jgi:hypothetical protein
MTSVLPSAEQRTKKKPRHQGVRLTNGGTNHWKCAATVALVPCVASLALALALTRDQRKVASEINAKTLKAAAAIKISPRLPLRVRN